MTDATLANTPARPVSTWTGWGQWLALITMTLDHGVRYLAPDAWGLEWIGASLGRIAFPLFAGMVAWHGLFNTRNPLRYARRILVIGLVAQLPFMLMPRASDALLLNVCFTLALGLAAVAWYQRWNIRWSAGSLPRWQRVGEPLLMLSAWFLAGNWVEYGHAGLLLVPAFTLAIAGLAQTGETRRERLVPVAGTLPLLAVAGLMNSSAMAKSFTVATCLGVLLLAAGAHAAIPRIPWPMPRRLWLAWYPAHFTAIAALLLIVGQAAWP
ncbi:TraX family protein [Halomonas sp. A11-A]|uniref:TraX family protein n=1 Tax=Halomonas sp. A11-A TaxID=2183985 RepID=UPI000D71A62C|nr:TraX family protein [Halomonas sp. A11-A]PWV75856.1 TraX protein [Halomonas sp. A11-A]